MNENLGGSAQSCFPVRLDPGTLHQIHFFCYVNVLANMLVWICFIHYHKMLSNHSNNHQYLCREEMGNGRPTFYSIFGHLHGKECFVF